jgi:NADH:ubiquinone oxidoreductase subunit F (NADH-binding)/(2Fe-2S) ferredoxin
MANCCDLCTHSPSHPCPDYIPCRTTGPLCHSSEACRAAVETEIDRITYGDTGLRINVGMSTCGLAAGAQQVYEAIEAELKQQGLAAKLVNVGCMGSCYAEVMVELVKKGAASALYSHVTPQRVPAILRDYLAGDVSGAFAVRSRVAAMTGQDDVPLLGERPFFRYQVRDAIQNCGIVDPELIEEYIVHGGYLALTHVLREMTGDEVIEAVSAAGLRGRGGAGFSTGLKWRLCRQAESDTKYIICNGDEGDPGAFMNRLTAEGDPHRVLEGLIIAAYAIGASEGYIFVRAEKPLMAHRLQTAVDQAKHHGLLGERILGSDFSLDVTVMLSAGAFVCGEETAMIAAIEGRRAMPKPRPPFPATNGLWDQPTTINNIETLAHVPTIITGGVQAFTRIGSESSKGTKVFCLAGKIARGGAAEVPLGTTIKRLVMDIGGGPLPGKHLKAIQTGGPGGGCLSPDFIDMPLDFETLQDAGSIMGSGGIIVVDEDTCIVDLAKYFLTFTTAESCGKCPPCREGTKRLLDLLTTITEGKGADEHLDQLQALSHVIMDSSLCALGRIAPNPVLTTLKYFRDEYDAHIREKRCPAHVCTMLVTYAVDPALCTGCGLCVQECPYHAIALRDVDAHEMTAGKRLAVIDPATCMKCGHCFVVCPFRAIHKR